MRRNLKQEKSLCTLLIQGFNCFLPYPLLLVRVRSVIENHALSHRFSRSTDLSAPKRATGLRSRLLPESIVAGGSVTIFILPQTRPCFPPGSNVPY